MTAFFGTHVAVRDLAIKPELLIDVLTDIKARGFQYGWRSNKNEELSHWNINFGGSKKKRFDAMHLMPDSVRAVWDDLVPQGIIMPGYRLIRGYVNAATYGLEGFPHTDSQVESDITYVIYLNPEWHPEWAGETVFFDHDDDTCRAVLPRFGRISWFPSAMTHAARAVSRVCPEQRLVLVLKAACE